MSSFGPRKVGNVRVFFHGRIVVGPDWVVMLASALFIIVCSLLFVCYTNTITSARVVVGLLAVSSLFLVGYCGLADPGICAKELPPPEDGPAHEPMKVDVTFKKPDGTTAVRHLQRKWCYSCNIYRPLRAVHCRFCDVCVCRRDHHCPWTGICIGALNYRSYFALVWCTFALVLASIIGGLRSIYHRAALVTAKFDAEGVPRSERRNSVAVAIGQTWGVELIVVVISMLWGLQVGFLAIYHTYLICTNRTSNDAMKVDSTGNVYDQGSVWRNIQASFFPPDFVMGTTRTGPLQPDEWAVTFEVEDAEMSARAKPALAPIGATQGIAPPAPPEDADDGKQIIV